jgi:hypothetical protein
MRAMKILAAFITALMAIAPAVAQETPPAPELKTESKPDQPAIAPPPKPSEEQVLRERLMQAMKQPRGVEAAAMRARLANIVDVAGQVAAVTTDPSLRLSALDVQAQSLSILLHRAAKPADAEKWLTKLRGVARRMKTLEGPEAAAAGEAWLVDVEMYEVAHSDLSPAEKSSQAEAAAEQFIAKHPDSPRAQALRELLEERRAKRAVIAKPSAPPKPEFKPLPDDGDGVLRFELVSPHEAEPNVIRVIVPEKLNPRKLGEDDGYRFLYVLPVESKQRSKFGDPAAAVKELDLANKHDLIVIVPSFNFVPWYVDHPADPLKQQEKYVLESLVPAVESRFVMHHPRRLLLGFSKSGWGAISLLMSKPEVFDAAAVFDAPLMMGWPTKYGSEPQFATEANFRRYELAPRVRKNADWLGQRPRLALIGYGNFHDEMVGFHDLLEELNIPHEYELGEKREHVWSSGWISPCVEALLKMTE